MEARYKRGWKTRRRNEVIREAERIANPDMFLDKIENLIHYVTT